jgi:hypothetical protein
VNEGDAWIRAAIALLTLAAALILRTGHWPHPDPTTAVPGERNFSTAPMVPVEKAPSVA